jgi:SPOR domain
MIRKLFLLFVVLCFSTMIVRSQFFVKTSDLFTARDDNSHMGKLNILQDPALDTLISRYILGYINLEHKNGYEGMEGYRIQIFNSSNRNAREESGKARAEFISKFPDIVSYPLFAEPGYYKIRVGDFRTKTEATRIFLLISKVFPDAYIVPDIINFPDQNNK